MENRTNEGDSPKRVRRQAQQMAANAVDLIKVLPLESTKFKGLPLAADDYATGNQIIKELVQHLQVDESTGFMAEMPEEVQFFFSQTPHHPSLGKAYALTKMGHALAWVMPKIKVGEEYKHIKPPKIPVFESKDRFDVELQCSTAIETQEFLECYNEPWVPEQIVSKILAQSTSAINNTIWEMFQFFWLSTICAGTNKFVFDKSTLPYFVKKITEEGKTSQGLLKQYQEAVEPFLKEFQKRAAKVKNFKWYDPTLRGTWMQKADNSVEISPAKQPAALGNDHKSFVKAIYTKGGNTKNTPELSREAAVYALLSKIRRTVTEMTSHSPRYSNWIGYDSSKTVAAADELYLCKCPRSSLVIVVSEWDFDELTSGVSLTGSSSKSLKLSDFAEGIKVIKIAGIPPGFAFVGERLFFSLFMRLNHGGQIFHLREEETQYITNVWFSCAVFTEGITGAVIAPAGNFTAPGEFYEEYASDLAD